MTTQDWLPGAKGVGVPAHQAGTSGGEVRTPVGDARAVVGGNGASGGGTDAPGGEAVASGGGTGASASSPSPRFPQRAPTGGSPRSGEELTSGRVRDERGQADPPAAARPGEGWTVPSWRGGDQARDAATPGAGVPRTDAPGTMFADAGPPAFPAEAPRRERAWPWAVAGVAAGVAGLGVAEVVGIVTGPTSTPLIAAAQAFIDVTPPWLKDFAVQTFGTNDKLALLSGASTVVVLLSAVTGLLARRRLVPAMIGVAALGAVGAGAALTRPSATAMSALPAAVGALVGMLLLLGFHRRGTRRGPDGQPTTARRQLLLASGAAVVGGAVAGVAGRTVAATAAGAEASRAAVRLPVPAAGTAVLPAGVSVGVPGVTPFRVANADFYRIDTATLVPRLSTKGWHLRIHGMVQRELSLDYPTLIASQLVEHDVTLMCVSNDVGGDLVGNARWLGLPIGPLLKQAGPLPGADMVLSKSADGWTAGTPLDVLTDGRAAMLAIAMNGVPLPIEHGFPVRMVVPGLYGYVSATKWVVDLEVTRFALKQGYWTPRGWSAQGPVKTESRIDVPRDGAQVKAGRVAVAGVAWAQHRGIKGVAVRVDDGPWQPAQLAAAPSTDTWRQWVYRWDAAPGHHRLAVRAVDGKGVVQTGEEAPPEPSGATGWHTIEVDVV